MTTWRASDSDDDLIGSAAAGASPAPDPESESYLLLDERIRQWMWDEGWDELRDIQESAVELILKRDDTDVIIAAATASGKTEAAFLPICSRLLDPDPAPGIRAVYISPLKALINDQFRRLQDLCDDLRIPVHRWHGDVPSSQKRKLIEKPSGILLITPESLEAVFVNHGYRVGTIFSALQFVVIDEVHAFIGEDRGRQLQSLLHRLESRLGRTVRRIGLSATLGDMALAAEFLRPRSAEHVEVISSQVAGQEIRLQVRGYVSAAETVKGGEADAGPAVEGAGESIAGHLYRTLRGQNNLVFANSRGNVEMYSDLLRQRCESERVPNEFFPHHGSLSREIREEVEARLKDPSAPRTAICTSTLELGIDIGRVASVGQIGAPFSVSSLRQRLGRSGRRGGPAVLRAYLSMSELGSRSHPLDRLRIELVQMVAMVELLKDRWCEPPAAAALHLSVLVQQILSVIAEHGGATAPQIWRVLGETGPFQGVGQPRFISLLRRMGSEDLLVQEAGGTLLPGQKGERLIGHFSFYTIFNTPEEYQVLHRGRPLGTLTSSVLLAEGLHLIFAGRRWRIIDVDVDQKMVTVEPSPGGKVPAFLGAAGGAIDDEIRRRMRQVWMRDDVPDYLDPTARRLLTEARGHFKAMGLATQRLVQLGTSTLFFVSRGDKIVETLALCLLAHGLEVATAGPALIIDRTSPAAVRDLLAVRVREGAGDPVELASQARNPGVGKYDWVLGDDLLHADYASRSIDIEGALEVARLEGAAGHPETLISGP